MATDGDADTDSTVRFTSASGEWGISSDTFGGVDVVTNINPNTLTYSAGRAGTILLRKRANPQQALLIHCGNDFNPGVMECWGFLSPAV